MAEGDEGSSSLFFYLWYTAVWYLILYLIMVALNFLSAKQLDKQLLQKSASDTMLFALVYISIQWSGGFLRYAVFCLPYVVLHMFVDLIPTLLWLFSAEISLLISLGLAQKLYNHLSFNKLSLSAVRSMLEVQNLASVLKSQARLEEALHKHILKSFPRFAERRGRPVENSALSVAFSAAYLVLQLSTLALVLVEGVWETAKTCYHRISSKRLKELKSLVLELLKLTGVTVLAAALLQYKTMQQLVSQTYSQLKNKNKSIKPNKATSVSEVRTVPPQPESDSPDPSNKQHDD